MVPQKVAAHYVGLLRSHLQTHGEGAIKLKKLLYAIRPAIALEWMRSNVSDAAADEHDGVPDGGHHR